MAIAPASPDMLDKIRQQFNESPYPRTPLEKSPKEEYSDLYLHNLITPHYLRTQKVVSTEGKLILDVGCGSGYTTLKLAEANPGAKIVGIDLSEASIDLAQKRLAHYGFHNTEFQVLTVEELSQLNQKFDYINCDEVLYLLLDPVEGLKAMRSVLAPEGVIRANFHSSLQRRAFFQAQEFAGMLGLMDEEQDESIRLLREVMANLRPNIFVKKNSWGSKYEELDGVVLANHLLKGDKGWTIPEFFSGLRQANLEFISMVYWQNWELIDLFQDVNELPLEIGLRIADASREEQLHMFELLHPSNNRLLDLWCGHAEAPQSYIECEDWTPEQWMQARLSLHPQFKQPGLREQLAHSAVSLTPVDLNVILRRSAQPVPVNGMFAACLLDLIEGEKCLSELMQRWRQVHPVNPVTLESTSPEEAYEAIQSQLSPLIELGFVLAELL